MSESQKKGGVVRAKVLSPTARRAIATAGAQARWAKADPSREKLPQAICGSNERPLQIGNIAIPAYVLDDERRVLTVSGMSDGLSMARGGSEVPGLNRFELFVSRERLRPYVSEELRDQISNPIVFLTPTGKAYGYDAQVLVELCEAILAARSDGKLQKQQEGIAQRAEILMRGLARVGIVALVDEATGYQEIRDRTALRSILEAYIAKEWLPWTQRFPLEFYQEMYRLLGWKLDPTSRGKPGYVGRLTNALVYDRLPLGVVDELRTHNPVDPTTRRRRFKHHQFLTEDIGNPHLEKHVSKVIGLMQASDNWGEFKRLFRRVFKPARAAGDRRTVNMSD
ncbi:P63C domain-containing protein [Muricoccus vinaceus]|uniref:P63C domain-containing protein n=1 Tax=Muricoccus vinaceus TaxID=424704 RepID=A0ABV6IVF3_9PROT